jgi:hypothetical protein
MTLMPVSNIFSSVDCCSSDGAERRRADRHRNRRTGIGGVHAALQAIGRLHRHRAHAVLAKVLLHLADDVHRRTGDGAGDADGVVDRGQVAAVELDVDHRADDLDDFSNPRFARCRCCHLSFSLRSLSLSALSVRRSPLTTEATELGAARYTDCAPATISMISRVIDACRTLFM